MSLGNYAMIANDDIEVFNTIYADEHFTYPGYYFIKVVPTVRCEIGMFYDSNTQIFYYDREFTKLEPGDKEDE